MGSSRTLEFSGARSVSAATPCSAACQSTPLSCNSLSRRSPPAEAFPSAVRQLRVHPEHHATKLHRRPPGDGMYETVYGRHSTSQPPSRKIISLYSRDVGQHLGPFVGGRRSLLSRIACLPTSAGGTRPIRTASSVHISVNATWSSDKVASMSCWWSFSMPATSAARSTLFFPCSRRGRDLNHVPCQRRCERGPPIRGSISSSRPASSSGPSAAFRESA